MEAKFKQTEIGIIPSDWDVKTLGDVFKFKNGLNKAKEYFGHGTPIVNYMDVFNNSGICKSDIKGKVSLTQREIKNYEVKMGDVFFTRTSETVDEIGISTVVLEDLENTVFSGFVLRGRPKNSLLELTFKKYCFDSIIVRKEITTTASYTTRALTNGRLLSNIKIPIPTKSEQIAIATALSDIDSLISNLDKLIEKKRIIKQGVMQELLTGKRRNSIYKGRWTEKKIGHYLKVKHGKDQKAIQNSNGKYPILGTSGIIGWSNQFMYNKPSVLIGRKGTIDKPQYFNTPFWTIDTLFYSEINDNCDPKFIFYKFQMIPWKDYNEASGVPSLNAKQVESIVISCPSDVNEQIGIRETLDSISNDISRVENLRDKYSLVKQGMMQTLLTGKIRLA